MLIRHRQRLGVSGYALVTTVALAALSGLLNLLPVQGIGALIDSLTGVSMSEQGLTRVWLALIGRDKPGLLLASVIVVYIVSGCVSTGYGYLSTRLGLRMADNCRKDGAKAVLLCSLEDLESKPSGDILATLTNDVESVQRAITAPLIGFVVGLFELLWVLIIFFNWNRVLGLGILVAISPLYFLTKWYNKGTEKLTRLERAENGLFTGLVQESLWAAPMFRVFDRHGYEFDRIKRSSGKRLSLQCSQAELTARYWLLVRGIYALGYSLATGFAVYGVLQGCPSPGSVLISWLYVQKLYGPIAELSRFGNMMRQGLVALERIERITGMPQSPRTSSKSTVTSADDRSRIRVEDVAFSYGAQRVLKVVSFDVSCGQAVAVVGASGEGKSTLAKILLGLYMPASGSVKAEMAPDRMTELPSIAAVFQEPMLIAGTVQDNILIGEELDDSSLKEVIRRVDPGLIAGLPNGIHTNVGDRGSKLSVGQQQRIALMRALYRRPDVLVADEPTSALDGQAEQRILAGLLAAKERSAIVLFSHRLNTVNFADHVIVLRDGVIREEGSPTDLMERGGEFARLFASEAEV